MPQTDYGTFTVEETTTDTKNAKLWNVILHNTDQHSFPYVIKLMREVFGKNEQDAEWLTLEIHQMGLAIVATVAKERAEYLKDKVDTYGADEIMIIMGKKSDGGLPCSIEVAE